MVAVGLLASSWGTWLLGWPERAVEYFHKSDRGRALVPTVGIARVYGIASICGGLVFAASAL